MKTIKFLCALVLSTQISSCASYIENLYRELDKGNPVQSAPEADSAARTKDPFSMYRNANQFAEKANTSNTPNRIPQVERKYGPVPKKRYREDDLNDNGSDGSLWSPSPETNYLFSKNDESKLGDIVVVNVKEALRAEIGRELRRLFPLPRPLPSTPRAPASTSDGSASEAANDKSNQNPEAAAKAAPPGNLSSGKNSDPEKVYDRISGVIVERINDKHFLLRGRKTVLFGGSKRKVELQALIASRDLNSIGELDSDKIIEQDIKVLK